MDPASDQRGRGQVVHYPASGLCPFVGCGRFFNSSEMLRYHVDSTHLYPPPQLQPQAQSQYHTHGQQITGFGSPHPLRTASFNPVPDAPISPTYIHHQQQEVFNCQRAVSTTPIPPTNGTNPQKQVSNTTESDTRSEIIDPEERKRTKNRITRGQFRDRAKDGWKEYIPQRAVRNPAQKPPPAHSSMPPPPIQNQDQLPNRAYYIPSDQQALSDVAKSWPAMAHVVLKDLIIGFGTFAGPQTSDDHHKLVQLFERFRADTRTLGVQLAKNDDILWQLFQMKVGTIQSEMLAQGELESTTQGKDPIATPPTTPVLPTEQLSDIVETWDSMDVAAQVRMLKKLLRSAKNTQVVVFECEDFCAEFRYDKSREARIDSEPPAVSHSGKEMSSESAQRPTPSKTPDPTSTGLDLQAMIEKSLCAMRKKRALERKALKASKEEVDSEEGTEPKRIKIDPLG